MHGFGKWKWTSVIVRSSIGGRTKCCSPYVRLSVCPMPTILSNWKAVESSNLVVAWPWNRVTERANATSSKGYRSRSPGTTIVNVKIVFRAYPLKSTSIYIKQTPNDHRHFLHISSNTFRERKRIIFAIFVCCLSSLDMVCTCSTFVPLCRRRFNRATAIISRTRYFPSLRD